MANEKEAVEQLTTIIEQVKSDADPSDPKEVAERIIEEVKEELQK